MTKKTTREENRAIWNDRIENWERSGFTASEFCRKNRLKPFQFAYWKRKLRNSQKSRKNEFVEIPKLDSKSLHTAGYEINIPGGISIRTDVNFDPESLKKLINTMLDCAC